jgi:anthranilate phosphoribosyltransferase
MRSIIKRIATGPELSKDISREEAQAGMRFVLDGQVDPVQAGIFLIALRMKRETDDENLGILDALREAAHVVTAAVDEVVDIADPYDGFNRTLPASPFLPVVLAACGIPAVSHGVERMGPKYGVTHRQVLRAAGVPVNLAPEQAAARLGDPDIGWVYVDQEAFCPKLHRLSSLRTLIVKRPAITTAEVLIGPLRGRRKTHLVTGYVHKPYPRIYALLARGRVSTPRSSCAVWKAVWFLRCAKRAKRSITTMEARNNLSSSARQILASIRRYVPHRFLVGWPRERKRAMTFGKIPTARPWRGSLPRLVWMRFKVDPAPRGIV